jgi:hypothetical protein
VSGLKDGGVGWGKVHCAAPCHSSQLQEGGSRCEVAWAQDRAPQSACAMCCIVRGGGALTQHGEIAQREAKGVTRQDLQRQGKHLT